MSISYPLAAPAIAGLGPADFSMSEDNQVGETESPMTFEQQYQVWPGQRWKIEATLPPMQISQAEQWIAFLGSLKGKFGTFHMGDYLRATPQGAMSIGSGGLVANSPGSNNLAGTNQLFVRGAVPNVANWAVAGDYLTPTPSLVFIDHQIIYDSNFRLYKVLTNANSDANGDVVLDIWPNLRETVADGRPIVTLNTFGTFRLQDNTVSWKVDRNKLYTVSFKAKEAIP
jgi:hypothetical protein